MKLKLMVVSAMLLAGAAHAGDWDEVDTARQIAVLSTFALDYSQTRDIKNHKNLYETNVFMGKHPSDVRVRNYFLGVGAAHTLIMYNTPKEWRSAVQYVTIAVELAVIARNRKLGLRFEF